MNTERMLKAKSLLVRLPIIVAALVGAVTVQAGESKPKETPTETASLNLTKIEYASSGIDGSAGPVVTLEGVLHLASQALLSDDGVPVGFKLHANLSQASASSTGSDDSFVAVASSEGIPAECLEAEACAPPFWVFTFRLIPQGSGLRPSLLVEVTVNTQYDEGGTLVNACVAGEEGCEVIGLVP